MSSGIDGEGGSHPSGVTGLARQRGWIGDPVTQVALALGLFLRVLHWVFAGREFEDGLITVTHARNAVRGLGLTHHAHEAVTHGFTSALSVLVPLAGEWVGAVTGFGDGFTALRLASLAAFVLSIAAAHSLCATFGVGGKARLFVLVYLAVDYNQIFYGMAGMETQLAVAILLAALSAVLSGSAVRTGVLAGLALLVRPDFVLFSLPAIAALSLKRVWAGVVSALVAAGVAAPWFIFTTLYYGAPLPNTIRAKSLRYHEELPVLLSPVGWWNYLVEHVTERSDWWKTFAPFYENGFVVEAPLPLGGAMAVAAVMLAFGICGAALSLRTRNAWPGAVFFAAFVAYRFALLPPSYYEWYYPPFTALLVLYAGVTLDRLRRGQVPLVGGASVMLALLFAWPLPALFLLDRSVQKNIEDRVRKPLGLWLRENVPPGQIVSSESAGYIGFYGGVKLYDYPGLTSNEAYRVMEQLGWQRNRFGELVNAARPHFVVWRPDERALFARDFPEVDRTYREVARFRVSEEETPLLAAGVRYQSIDREFLVARREEPAKLLTRYLPEASGARGERSRKGLAR